MAVALIAALVKKNRILLGIYIGILVTCFASYIHMFPVQDRLWCFFYSLIMVLSFIGLEELTNFAAFVIKKLHLWNKIIDFQVYIVGFVIVILVLSNKGIRTYLERENVYWKQEEVNQEILYLENNIKSDDMIYVYSGAVNAFQYKNGFGNTSFGGYENNVIFGTTNFSDTSDCEEDIEKIISHDKIYIACAHYVKDERLSQLLKAVYENGYFQLISFEHETPLWFYCQNLSDSKIHVSYEVIEHSENDNTENLILRIHNDGDAYINHNWESVGLVSSEDGSRMELDKNIAPGNSVDIVVSYKKGNSPVFQLENEYGLICEDSEIKIEEFIE